MPSTISSTENSPQSRSFFPHPPAATHPHDCRVAKDLDQYVHALFSELSQSELTLLLTSSKHPGEQAAEYLQLQNLLTYYFVLDILSSNSSHQRAKKIQKLVHFAEYFFTHHNFQLYVVVMTALNFPAITRLRKTWKHLSPQTEINIKQHIQIISSNQIMMDLMEKQKSKGHSIVPFLVPVKAHITRLQDDPNVLDPQKHIDQILSEFDRVNHHPEEFEPDQPEKKQLRFTKIVLDVRTFEWNTITQNLDLNEICYQISQQLEPKIDRSITRSKTSFQSLKSKIIKMLNPVIIGDS